MARFDPDSMSRFKRGPRGEILFYPRGIFGRGYEVPDETRAEAIARRADVLTRWANLSAYLLTAMAPIQGWQKIVLLCALLAASGVLVQWRLQRAVVGLRPTETRLRLREVLAKANAELVAEVGATCWWIRVAIVVVFVALMISLSSR